MLSDPGTARFITADGKPVTDELVGWRNAAIMAGHWVLASQAVARRLGAEKEREIDLFGHIADLWVTSRDKWQSVPAATN
jgi:hypothetical protein